MGLPTSFAQLDIDKQLEVFKDRLKGLTGSDDLAQFTDEAAVAKLTGSISGPQPDCPAAKRDLARSDRVDPVGRVTQGSWG